MDGGAVVLQILGLVVLLSWLFLAASVVAARQGGIRDAESMFLGWLAQRDYDVWNDYVAFMNARKNAWKEERP